MFFHLLLLAFWGFQLANASEQGERGLVIFLHGLTQTGAAWSHMPGRYDWMPHVSWLIPTGPVIPQTPWGGRRNHGWFDIGGFPVTKRSTELPASIHAGVDLVMSIIDDEVSRGMRADRIVLAGCSQGGLMALTAGLHYHHRLAGVASLSGWLGLRDEFPGFLSEENRQTPVWLAHAPDDDVVHYNLALMTNETLSGAGLPVELHVYPGMKHRTSEEEFTDFGEWLARVLPP
eukprot:Rmarinus@m.7643